MILVTGATGTVGSKVVEQLVGRGAKVRAMSRREIEIPGAEVVHGDFEDPRSLIEALSGVEAAFLVTAPSRPVIDHDEAFASAARTAGVQRLTKLSAISAADPDSWHHRAEQPTRDSGLDWTVLRPGTFASNLFHYAPMIQNGDTIPNWTSTGAIGVIDPRDIAAVAVEVLTSVVHIGRELVLTGPRLLTFDQQIAVLNEVLGKEIRTQHVALDVAHDMMLRDGMDPETAQESVAGMARLADGRYAFLTDEVPKILGRPATSLATWAHDHRGAFHQVAGGGDVST